MTDRTVWWGPELEELLAVAVATLDDAGTVLGANTGFRRLTGPEDSAVVGSQVERLFVQPGFQSLQSMPPDSDGNVYVGLLTVGNALGDSRTLRARVWRSGNLLCLLAEHDIADLERLTKTVLQLNDDYAVAQVELSQLNFKLQQREAQILESSLTDQLTGVGNRRRLEQSLAVEVERTVRTGQPLSGLMTDIDHFKRVNDTYGHDVGDLVLAAFGTLLREQSRKTDVVARYGGEEFVVLMPGTGIDAAADFAQRIRSELATVQVPPVTRPISASFGVAEFRPGETGALLLKRMDQAMYRAKASGRDQVVVD